MSKNGNEFMMGAGDIYINGVHAGYLEKETKIKFSAEIYEAIFDVPQVRAAVIPLKQTMEIIPAFAQFNMTNLQYALGGLTPTTIAGTLVDKTASFEALTATHRAKNPGLYGAKMGATANMETYVTISSGADAPVLKNVAETVTYVEDADYIVDYTTGDILFIPTGSHFAGLVSDSYVFHAKYKYTPVTAKRLDFGKAYARSTFELKAVLTNPLTTKTCEIVLWKAQSNDNFEITANNSSIVVLSPTFYANYDGTAHPDNPYGYLLLQD